MSKLDLVPIKVVLGLRPNGHLDWPAFNRLPANVRGDIEWSKFVDIQGIGWHYDQVESIGKGASVDTPCTLVPKAFADAAVAMFPEVVFILTEREWEIFYDDRARVEEPEEFLDTEVLQGILARVQLEEKNIAPPPSQSILDRRVECLDPNNIHTRGIRKNEEKTWKLLKQNRNYTIHSDHVG